MKTFISHTLKSLETDYGRWGYYVRQTFDNDPNVDSVQLAEDARRVKVILLPNTFERTKGNLTGGGNYDLGTRWIMIRKVPMKPFIQDKIRVDSKEYTVLEYETLDDEEGHLFKCQAKEEGVE